MQPINFAQLSSKKHKAVRQWFLINCFLIGLLLGICAFFTAKQWNAYHAARNHAQNIAVSQPIQQKNNAQKLHRN